MRTKDYLTGQWAGRNLTLTYDGQNRLGFVYDATTDTKTDYVSGPNGALARIKRHAGMDTTTFLHADHLGTARSGTAWGGQELWEDYHTPFGESLIHPDATDDQGDYTGHIRDKKTGLSYMQARYQDPLIGRFLSEDVIGILENNDPGHFNRYAYSLNNPINRVDPDGNQSIAIFLETEIFLGVGGSVSQGSFSSQLSDGTPVNGRIFQERVGVGADAGVSIGVSVTEGNINDLVGTSASVEGDIITGPYGVTGSVEVGGTSTTGNMQNSVELGVNVGPGNAGVTNTHLFIRRARKGVSDSLRRRAARYGEKRAERSRGEIYTWEPHKDNPECLTDQCRDFYEEILELDDDGYKTDF